MITERRMTLRATSRIALVGLTALCLASAARGADDAESKRMDRIAGLCRAWTAAKYVHPALARGGIDWDAAFTTAAMAVDGGDVAGYRRVADAMLARIGDPSTRLSEPDATPPAPAPAAPAPGAEAAAPAAVELVHPLGDGNVLVALTAWQRANGDADAIGELSAKLPPALASATGLIVDARVAKGDEAGGYTASYVLGEAAPFLVPHAVESPGGRWRPYRGYPAQRGGSSGGYWAGIVEIPGTRFEPAGKGGPWRVVFLVSPQTPLHDVIWALGQSGDGRLVSEEPIDVGAQVTFGVPLGDGLVARVRGWEAVAPQLEVDTVAPTPGADAALAEARRLLGSPWERPDGTSPPAAVHQAELREATYAEPRLPPPGLRALAGCRAWGVIRYFYPYLPLIGDWDGAFRASLPELLAASDEDAYARAVLRLMAHVADGHTAVTEAPAVERLLGAAWPPLRLEVVEGKPVVAAVDASLAGRVVVGDVVTSVDGEAMGARMDRLRPLIAAATDGNRELRVARAATGGAAGSKARLELVGAAGTSRAVEVERGAPWSPPRPEGNPWRRLAPRIGYVDLNYLRGNEVKPMLEELADTDAIVFDMRGYPQGVFWILGPRLNVRNAQVAAVFRGVSVEPTTFAGGEEGGRSGYFFEQPVGAPVEPLYRGKVVMLVNERTQSQAEHTGLFLEAANGTKFIGSPTAGANGDVTVVTLPGGVWVRFSGHDVRHADGRQLQRMGLQPDVLVRPTIAGLRAGRDEVLERAVAWLGEAMAKR
jgi:C-terminal processing protease CtpA/Prc